MVVFKYIEDKDVFQKFYSKMLAKRLIYHMSASDDAEASMISKLKQACGFEYTSKLQRMFQDIGVSKLLNEQYRDSMKAITSDIDFGILVLSCGSWPFNQSFSFSLPSEVSTVSCPEDLFNKCTVYCSWKSPSANLPRSMRSCIPDGS
jgi:cullin 1